MRKVMGSVAAGVAGNAVFAVINGWLDLVQGPAWIVAMILVFLVFAGLAFLALDRGAGGLISRIRAKRDAEIEVEDATVEGNAGLGISDVSAGRDARITVRGVRSR